MQILVSRFLLVLREVGEQNETDMDYQLTITTWSQPLGCSVTYPPSFQPSLTFVQQSLSDLRKEKSRLPMNYPVVGPDSSVVLLPTVHSDPLFSHSTTSFGSTRWKKR